LEVLGAGKQFVSFGTMKFDVFFEVQEALGSKRGADIPVLIYPSQDEDGICEEGIPFEVSWAAQYVGWAATKEEMKSDFERGHRPKSTDNETEAIWGLYWRVQDLHRLPADQRISISKIQTYGGKYWRKNAPPRGPEIVRRPSSL
jgi:hypothetical protein